MTPCPSCSRHVRDTTCPFCGAAVVPAARSAFVGPVTRAAIFSALAGCWTGSAPAEQQTTTVDHHIETSKSKPPTTAGTIEGTVTDSNGGGAPVAYAQVTLVEANRVATTDGQGHYKFEGVAQGTYTLRVTAQGNNPRSGGGYAQTTVALGDAGARADIEVAMPVYHYNPNQTPMPYGAPPARKRIV